VTYEEDAIGRKDSRVSLCGFAWELSATERVHCSNSLTKGSFGGLASLFLELAYRLTIVGENVVLLETSAALPSAPPDAYCCFNVGACCLNLEIQDSLVMVEILFGLPVVGRVLLSSIVSTASFVIGFLTGDCVDPSRQRAALSASYWPT
jgi:hypothetical protein